jgi:hypothetical protein
MITSASRSTFTSAAPEDRSGLLRFALKLDAVVTGTLALLVLAAGHLLGEPLGVPTTLLWSLGLFLVAYAAAIWAVGARPTISRAAAWAAVELNLLWVVGSVGLVAAGWLPLTVLGTVFVLAQAVGVLSFVALQMLGLRRAGGGQRAATASTRPG